MEDKFLKEVARSQLEALGQYRSIVYEQHSQSFRWLTASLLALNGGAALALLNDDRLEPIAIVRSGIFFVMGIVAALLIGVLAQRAVMRGIQPIQEQIGYWINVLVDGERDSVRESELLKNFAPSLKLSFFGQICGWLSALFFLAGLVNIAFEFAEAAPSSANKPAIDAKRGCKPPG